MNECTTVFFFSVPDSMSFRYSSFLLCQRFKNSFHFECDVAGSKGEEGRLVDL